MGKKRSGRRSGSAKPQKDDGPEGPEWVEKNFEWFQELHRQQFAEAANEKDQVDQYTVSAEMEGKRFDSQEQRVSAQANSRLSMNTLVSGFEPGRHTMFVAGRPVQARPDSHMCGKSSVFTMCHV